MLRKCYKSFQSFVTHGQREEKPLKTQNVTKVLYISLALFKFNKYVINRYSIYIEAKLCNISRFRAILSKENRVT